MKKVETRPPEVKIWQLQDVGEAIRGPLAEPIPKTLSDGLIIGLLETGTVRASYRRGTHTLRRGAVILAQPDEAIAFEPARDASSPIRICLNCPSGVLQKVANEIAGRRTAAPFFPNFVTPDPHLATQFSAFQRMLDTPISLLERSSRFHDILTWIIRRHASHFPTPQTIRSERSIVRLVRQYLHESYMENVTLDELARMVGLSAFHLNRVFRMEVGLPPHAYQTQLRVTNAKLLLARGLPINEVATAVGFFDQSHFTNKFRHIVGCTPGVYQKALRAR